MAKFVIYRDIAGQYRWRLVAHNGEKVAERGLCVKTRRSKLGKSRQNLGGFGKHSG